MRISLKRLAMGVAVPLIGVGALLLANGPASAAASITVTPNTNLTSGQKLTVTGSGFAKNSLGGILECNSDKSQPTVIVSGSTGAPVSCSSPFNDLAPTSATGTMSGTITVKTGTTGPPATGTDSSGHPAANDAALFPCPPTPAQIALGDTCVIAYGDLAGDQAVQPITFVGQATTTTAPGQTTTTLAGQTTTTAAPVTTTTAAPVTTTSAPQATVLATTATTGTLPVTGSGRRLLGLAVLGAGFVVLGAGLTAGGRRARRRGIRS